MLLVPLLLRWIPTASGCVPCSIFSSHPKVFVELNELLLDKNQEPQWRETARWIKFEEDVEEETERWGKPHVASLSFRSLLELRRTLAHGTPPFTCYKNPFTSTSITEAKNDLKAFG